MRQTRGLRWALFAVAVGVIGAVAVGALVVAGDALRLGPPPAPPPDEEAVERGQALDWSEDLHHIGVSAEALRRDWNDAIDSLGFGHELEPFTFPEQPYGMGAETNVFPDGTEFEVIEHPDGFVSRMELRGEPADIDEAADYLGMVYALIQATSGLDREQAVAFAGAELGLDETIDEADHSARATHDEVVYEFATFHGEWRLWAGSARDVE